MSKSSRSIEVALCLAVTAGATASLLHFGDTPSCPQTPLTPIIRVESQTPAAMSSAVDIKAERRAMRAELRAMRADMLAARGLPRRSAPPHRFEHAVSRQPCAKANPAVQKAQLATRAVDPAIRPKHLEGRHSAPTPEAMTQSVEYTTIQRRTLDDLIRDREAPFRQFRAAPSMRNGEVIGLKVNGMREGTLLQTLGFRNGDTLTAINDHSFASMDSAMSAYRELSNRGSQLVRVSLIRRGEPMVKFIEVR